MEGSLTGKEFTRLWIIVSDKTNIERIEIRHCSCTSDDLVIFSEIETDPCLRPSHLRTVSDNWIMSKPGKVEIRL